MTSFDEDALRERWRATIPEGDFDQLAADVTYRPPKDDSATSAKTLIEPPVLPTLLLDTPLQMPLVADKAEAFQQQATLIEPAQAELSETLIEAPKSPAASQDPLQPTIIEGPPGALSKPIPGAFDKTLVDSSGGPSQAPTAQGPQSNYQIVEELGRGGMGVVYRAVQRSLGREVAVKTVQNGHEARHRMRFISEARVTGLLDHPNIIPVYDLGGAGGDVFLAMKLVGGRSWNEILHAKDEDAKNLVQQLGILISVCHALSFAHSRGIVHNDLKPENIMIGEFGEVFVMDWGLAVDYRDFDEWHKAESRLTSSAAHKSSLNNPCGTPAYMPPELADGQGEQIGPWTDVYLLGAILHEILTGRPPHTGKTLIQVLKSAVMSHPPSFEGAEDIPESLKKTCRKALSADVDKRHQSVAELREDLEEFLQHRESLTITARAEQTFEDCARVSAEGGAEVSAEMAASAERNRLYSQLAETVSGFQQALLLWPGNERAKLGRQKARELYARAALGAGDLGLAEAQCADLPPGLDSTLLVSQAIQEAKAFKARRRFQAQAMRWGLIGTVTLFVLGLILGIRAIGEERDQAAQNAAEARKAEQEARQAHAEAKTQARKARQQLALGLVERGDGYLFSQRFPEARESFETASRIFKDLENSDLTAQMGLWRSEFVQPQALVTLPGNETEPSTLAVLHSGTEVFVGDTFGTVRRRDLWTGKELWKWRLIDGPICDLKLSNDGHYLAAGGVAAPGRKNEKLLSLCFLHENRMPVSLKTGLDGVNALAFSPASRRLLTGNDKHLLCTWDLSLRQARDKQQGSSSPMSVNKRTGILAVDWAPNGTKIFGSIYGHATVILPDQSKHLLRHHRASICSVALSRNGQWAATGTNYGWIKLWDVKSGLQIAEIRKHKGPVFSLQFSRDSKTLLSAGYDRSAKLFDVKDAKLLRSFGPHRNIVTSARFADDERVVVTNGEYLGRLVLWPVKHGRETVIRRGHAKRATRLVLSPDRQLMVVLDERRGIDLWHGPSQRFLKTLSRKRDQALCAAFSDDSRKLLTGHRRALCLWDLKSGTIEATIEFKSGNVRQVDFWGDTWLSNNATGTVTLWNAKTREAIKTWNTDKRFSYAGLDFQRRAAPHTHGREQQPLLGAVQAKGCIEVFKGAKAETLRSFKTDGFYTTLRISDDGRRLLAARTEKRNSELDLKVWSLDTGALLHDQAVRLDGNRFQSYSLSGDGRFALLSDVNGQILVWDISTQREVLRLADHASAAADLVMTEDNTQLLSVGCFGELLVRDFRMPERLKALRVKHGEALEEQAEWWFERGLPERAAALLKPSDSPELSLQIALARDDFKAALSSLEAVTKDKQLDAEPLAWTLLKEYLQSQVKTPQRTLKTGVSFTDLVVDRARGRVAVAGMGQELCFYEANPWRPLTALYGHLSRVNCVALARTGTLAITGSEDRCARVWSLDTGRCLRVFGEHKQKLSAVDLCMSRGQALVVSRRGRVFLYALSSGRLLRDFGESKRTLIGALFLGDGGLVATASTGGEIRLWSSETGALVREIEAHKRGVSALAEGQAGQLISGGRDGLIKVWQVETGALSFELKGHKGPLRVLRLDRVDTGQRLLSADSYRQIHLWKLPEKRLLWSVKSHEGAVSGADFLDRDHIVSAGRGGELRWWDLRQKQQ